MESSSEANAELRTCIRQQEIVAELGRRTLDATDLDQLMDEATEAVADALDTDYCGLFEAVTGRDEALLRAGVGWRDGLVGSVAVPTGPDSQVGYTLDREAPTVVADLREDGRFAAPDLLADHGVVSAVGVPVGPPDDPWGALGVYATAPRAFDDRDVHFVRSVANVIASAIENERTRSELDEIYGRISDAFFALDEELRFTYLNERAHEIINPGGRTLVGEKVREVFPDAVEQQFEAEYERAMREQETVSFEEYYPEPLDAWFEVRAYPSETGLSVYFRDVTERKERESELERYERLAENLPVGIYRNTAGPEGEFVEINDTMTSIFDADSKAALLECSVSDLYPDPDERVEFSRRLEREGLVEDVELEQETLDGEQIWISVTAMKTEEDGEVFFDGIVQDVTERKRTQQQLEEERDVFAQGPAIVFRWKNEPGWPVEYVSENVEDVLGYAPSELESGDVPYTDLLLDEEIDRIAREVERNSDETTERFSHEPYRVKTRDGDVRWVKDTTKIVRDETGTITHYLGYLVDITERKEREQELKRYEAIVEAVDDGVYVVDDDGRFTMVNDAYARMVDYDREDLLGEHVSLVADEDVIEETRRAEAAMRDGATDAAVVEAELETATGDRFPAEATFALLPTADGDARRVGVVRDVTERKQRERALERTERRFEAIFEDPNILVGLLEPDGTVLDINQTAMEYIDADLDEVTGEPFWETPWWGEGDEVGDDVREWTERASSGEYVDFQADLTRPDGEQYTLEGFFRPVTNDDGEVVSIIVSDRDVTERREYERQLVESERRYRTLAEAFPNGVVTLYDEDMRYTLAAGRAFEDLPVSPDDLEARTPREAWGDDVADALEPALRAALEGEEESVEVSYAGREWVVHAVPITDDDGDVFAGMTMAQDVTEQVERERKLEATVEKLEESNERLESFASMLAHELRNPVTIGQIYSQQLPDETESESGSNAEAVEYVTEAFDRIEEMIDVMLVLTRGREAVGERTPIDLAAMAREVWDDVDAPDATLDVEIDRTIQADETYVRHLFRNLFDNAVQHGGRDVTVRVGETEDGFYVEDDGKGIPEGERESVFEEGYTTAAGQGGTGLGLAFVRELAEVYEWETSVTESESGGARFEFTNVGRDA